MDPFEALAAKELQTELEKTLDRLWPRHGWKIKKRYGIDPRHPEGSTMKAVGEACAVTPERIRQIESKVLRSLRKDIETMTLGYLYGYLKEDRGAQYRAWGARKTYFQEWKDYDEVWHHDNKQYDQRTQYQRYQAYVAEDRCPWRLPEGAYRHYMDRPYRKPYSLYQAFNPKWPNNLSL